MLIEFKVTNYKSIKEEQAFSMVASSGKELTDSNTFEVEGLKNRYLPSAAIYGANASGKTNLLLALLSMRKTVLESHLETNAGDNIYVIPFMLNPDTRNSPSEFEVIFVASEVRYQYGFSATSNHIVDEWLFAFPEGRPQLLFEREMSGQGKYKWKFGTRFKGQKKVWQESTRPNALFLSTAIQLNSDQLKPVYDWFGDTLQLNALKGWSPEFRSSLCETNSKKKVLGFLNQADLRIDDLIIIKEPFDPARLPQDIPDSLKTVYKVSKGESVEFDLNHESDGMQKVFSLAGIFLDCLEKGHVVCVDNLHDNLHPELVKFLVGLFNNRKTNRGNAQLIFTIHETSMLNQNIMRRDQIWFCEKGESRATKVFSLQDFKPRKGVTNLELAYRSGIYGALPYIGEVN